MHSGRNLDDVAEVSPLNVVVSFDEDLSQDGLADGVVFGVELVKAMKSVSILQRETEHWVSYCLSDSY